MYSTQDIVLREVSDKLLTIAQYVSDQAESILKWLFLDLNLTQITDVSLYDDGFPFLNFRKNLKQFFLRILSNMTL